MPAASDPYTAYIKAAAAQAAAQAAQMAAAHGLVPGGKSIDC